MIGFSAKRHSWIYALVVSLLCSTGVFGQGTVNFSNLGGTIRTAPSKGGASVPAGSTYMAALYWAPLGTTDPSSFAQVGASATFLAPGIILGGTRTAPLAPPGATANFQIRSWEVATGASYELAAANFGAGHIGESAIISVDTGDPTSVPAGLPGSLGPVSFQMRIANVPEPSSFLYGGVVILGCMAVRYLGKRRREA